jgi:hypothetical protein
MYGSGPRPRLLSPRSARPAPHATITRLHRGGVYCFPACSACVTGLSGVNCYDRWGSFEVENGWYDVDKIELALYMLFLLGDVAQLVERALRIWEHKLRTCVRSRIRSSPSPLFFCFLIRPLHRKMDWFIQDSDFLLCGLAWHGRPPIRPSSGDTKPQSLDPSY